MEKQRSGGIELGELVSTARSTSALLRPPGSWTPPRATRAAGRRCPFSSWRFAPLLERLDVGDQVEVGGELSLHGLGLRYELRVLGEAKY